MHFNLDSIHLTAQQPNKHTGNRSYQPLANLT